MGEGKTAVEKQKKGNAIDEIKKFVRTNILEEIKVIMSVILTT